METNLYISKKEVGSELSTKHELCGRSGRLSWPRERRYATQAHPKEFAAPFSTSDERDFQCRFPFVVAERKIMMRNEKAMGASTNTS